MARGPGRRVSPRLIASTLAAALVAASCAPIPSATPVSPTASVAPPTTTTTTASTTTSTSSGTVALPDIGVEVRVPEGEGPFPAVVLVHGGAWVAGAPSVMTDLARFLSDNGYLTVNTPYTLSVEIAGYPIAVDDVACAVRYAAAHPRGDGTVAILGHSAGAHLAALVALDDGVYGNGCPLVNRVVPDRLVGLAGPYDVARLGPLLLPFFGVGPTEDPETWTAGNPMSQTGNNPGLSSLLMHGEDDAFVDLSFATRFADALEDDGSEALVEVVEGARHNDMYHPAFVGDLILTWLERQVPAAG
ncbi:MAG: alpha/beta hydrolase [Acidimicrobiia bacterium]